jgi:hypothetical protein
VPDVDMRERALDGELGWRRIGPVVPLIGADPKIVKGETL